MTRKTYPIEQDAQTVKVYGRVNAQPNGGHHIRNEFRRRELGCIDKLSPHMGYFLANRSKTIQQRICAQRKWRRGIVFVRQVVYAIPPTPESTTYRWYVHLTARFILGYLCVRCSMLGNNIRKHGIESALRYTTCIFIPTPTTLGCIWFCHRPLHGMVNGVSREWQADPGQTRDIPFITSCGRRSSLFRMNCQTI